MRKLAELNIKEMFTAYKSYFANGHAQYYCGRCFQRFAADWNIRANPINPWVARGNYVRCPYCGALHDRHIGHGKVNEYIPLKLKLSVVAYKKAVTLNVNYEATAFTEELFIRQWCKGREVFKFDVEKGESIFTQEIERRDNREIVKEKAIYPINQKFVYALLNGSILRFLRSNCLANKLQRSEMTSMLRIIRETLTKIFETKKGLQLGSTYINAQGHEAGMLLLPLINLAHRIECPEADNLTCYTKFDTKIDNVYTLPLNAEIPCNWAEQLYKQMEEEGADLISAMLMSVDLPNKTAVRKIVGNDYKSIGYLQRAFSLCGNYDLAIRLFNAIRLDEMKTTFFRELLPIYGEDGIVRFAENAKEYNLDDCIRLYKLLNESNKQIINSEHFRLRELHDWIALAHRKQDHKNIPLNVPEHIIRRLSMQLDQLKFFLPKESIELLETGHSLHNCVASYGEAMKDRKRWIVVVADDNGKRVACLEVDGNKLIQAKIDRNKAVKLDTAINKAVIDWAKSVNLTINTQDVEVVEKARQNNKAC